ncbi:MAG: hemolysin family protein [Moraxellaceae bacterium]|nr:hemolysin family protein [Moraxellaceae bacterium]MDZ4297893.1 hemolysin family protein [Moraxellaceae bacterium]MDZ4386065.1 hemolysin family protein [Moraxellaceae bacterium]
MSSVQLALLLLALIAASAFFSVSEISLAASRRLRLQTMADEGNLQAAAVIALQEKPGLFFTGIQVGVNAIAILAGIFGESALTPALRETFSTFYDGSYLDPVSQTLSFIFITSLFILFADLIPKRMAMLAPETIAMSVVGPINTLIKLFKPIVWVFNFISEALLKRLGIRVDQHQGVTSDDLYAVVAAGAHAGVLMRQEQQVIENVFELESRLVTSAMTTRESIIYMTRQETEAELRQLIRQHTHSKFPVCDDSIDRIVGYVDSKDLLLRILDNQPLVLSDSDLIKPVMTVPDSLTLSELLAQFRASRQDFALVINEYALVVGVVTLNDVMNTVMGDLVHDNQQQIVRRDNGSWLIDGFTPVEDVMRVLGIDAFPDDSQYETIAGFIMFQLRKVPKLTDTVTHAGYSFEVIDIDNHRIDQLLVTAEKPTTD